MDSGDPSATRATDLAGLSPRQQASFASTITLRRGQQLDVTRKSSASCATVGPGGAICRRLRVAGRRHKASHDRASASDVSLTIAC